MIAKIVEFSVRNRYLVILAWLGIAIWGIYAVLHTPVDAIPDLSENQVIVFADWMGRSPQDIEEQITYPLSVQLQGLAGVKAVRASSEFNFSMINVIFDEKTDFYFARQRVQERLATAQAAMPQGVIPYMAPDATALGQIYWYTVEGGNKSLDELRAIQDYTVRYQLASVPGVSEVASVGGMVREYQVDVDPAKLRAFDLSLGQLYTAIGNSNLSVGGKVIVENSSEYLVRGTGWLRGVEDLEKVVVASRAGVPIQLKQVATIQLGPEFRRSALEKNGREVTGGVVMMRFGENPLRVTEAIKKKIVELQPGLPEGVRIVPFYDRTRLIESAIHTVTGTLKEEMLIASIAILLILSHFRSALVVCVTLPMAVLVSFLFMYYLGIPSNIMSLCGIAISIGILVDAAVVMVENASHELKADAESRPHPGKKHPVVAGDTTEIVVRACRLVGRPIFFSVLIMLISFLPVFSFGGQEGKLSHPLAYTKSFAMIGVALLAISFVPALIPILIRGRIRGEEENWIVRSFIHIYKPTITWIIDRPAIVWWIMSVILAIGAGLLGATWLTFVALAFGLVSLILGVKKDGWSFWLLVALLGVILLAMGVAGSERAGFAGELLSRSTLIIPITAGAIMLLAMIMKHWRTAALTSFLIVAFVADTKLIKLGSEFMPTLNEGSILDMPTSAPRIAMGQAVDDVMVRDRVLRSYPEVDQVVGKVGRADTATDPSPLDMVETVITLRPTDWWPKRKMRWNDTVDHAARVARAMAERGVLKADVVAADEWKNVARAVEEPKFLEQNPKYTTATEMLNMAASTASEKFDAELRGRAIARQREYEPALATELMRTAYDALLEKAGAAVVKVPTDAQRDAIIAACTAEHGVHLVEVPRQEEVDKLLVTMRKALAEGGYLADRVDLLMDDATWWRETRKFVSRSMGFEPKGFSQRLRDKIEERRNELWQAHVKKVNWELFDYGTGMMTGLLSDSIAAAAKGTALQGAAMTEQARREISDALTAPFVKEVFLWRKTKHDVLKEMDSELQMPGWGNAWTQPIINRVNMLATGVRTQIGVKVFGPTGKPLDASIEDIQTISEEISAKLKTVRGAVDVIADQAVGKRYLEVQIDRDRAARYGVNMSDVAQAIEVALGGAKVTTTIEGRQRFPVRLRYAQADWQNLDAVKHVLVTAQTTPAELLSIGGGESGGKAAPAMGGASDAMKSGGAKTGGMGGGGMGGGGASASATPSAAPAAKSSGGESLQMPAPGAGVVQIPLSMVADIRVIEGPSMIKSENGRLRNYVTLNVRDRDILSFVEEARSAIAPIEAKLAGTGMSVEWSGEFEHQVRANQTLAVIFPMVIVVILFLLYITFHDVLDTGLAFLAVMGALSGALMMQSLFGFNRSVIVSIGYIAAFGMGTQTAVIMLVYLREAIDKRGGLANIQSVDELRTAVIEGAVHRLRPKLLTEGVAIIGLVPMLWATGTGAEIMRPMAAPVLGGLLISDEVVDLMIPVLFYWIRKRRWEKLHGKAETSPVKQDEVALSAS